VHQYEDPRAGPRCHVFLLDLYLSKIPNRAKDQDIFYLRPLPSVPLKESLPWFTCAPVGKNTLSQMTKKMRGEAKIDGNKTNHSLRAYAMSTLFQAGIPEKVIQDHTGHKSLDGLRKYESISEQQKQEVCRVFVTCRSDQEIGNMGARIPNSLPGHSHGVIPMAYQQSSSFGMNMPFYCTQQQQPSATFSGANISGCTINVFQAPTIKHFQVGGESDLTKLEVQELFRKF